MFRIIKTGNQPIWSGGVDPNAEFEPGQIAQLTIVGDKVICVPREEDEDSEDKE